MTLSAERSAYWLHRPKFFPLRRIKAFRLSATELMLASLRHRKRE
jgi:hypothetical protein